MANTGSFLFAIMVIGAPEGGNMLKVTDPSAPGPLKSFDTSHFTFADHYTDRVSQAGFFKNLANAATDVLKELQAQGGGLTNPKPPTSQAMHGSSSAPSTVPWSFAVTPAVSGPAQGPVATIQQPQAVPRPFAAIPAVPWPFKGPVATKQQPQAVPEPPQGSVAAKQQPQVAATPSAPASVAAAAPAPSVSGLKVQGEEDPCTCMKWSDVYKQSGGKCGETGREFATSVPLSSVGIKNETEQLCTFFYEKINDNFCMNWRFSSYDMNAPSRQWCYVSPQCKDFGKEVGRGDQYTGRQTDKLAIKVCSSSDRKLYDMAPMEIEKIAKTQGVDLAILLNWAYPWMGDASVMTEAVESDRAANEENAIYTPYVLFNTNGYLKCKISNPDAAAQYLAHLGDIYHLTCS